MVVSISSGLWKQALAFWPYCIEQHSSPVHAGRAPEFPLLSQFVPWMVLLIIIWMKYDFYPLPNLRQCLPSLWNERHSLWVRQWGHCIIVLNFAFLTHQMEIIRPGLLSFYRTKKILNIQEQTTCDGEVCRITSIENCTVTCWAPSLAGSSFRTLKNRPSFCLPSGSGPDQGPSGLRQKIVRCIFKPATEQVIATKHLSFQLCPCYIFLHYCLKTIGSRRDAFKEWDTQDAKEERYLLYVVIKGCRQCMIYTWAWQWVMRGLLGPWKQL